MDDWQLVLTLVALVAAAISGGAFFAFSNFVMPALDDLQPARGVAAMQSINRAAPSPSFVAAIVGAGLVGLPAAYAELDHLDGSRARFLVLGALLSLASFGITVAINVPKNDALDRLDVEGATTTARWADYMTTWTRANSVRSLVSLASVVFYALSLVNA